MHTQRATAAASVLTLGFLAVLALRTEAVDCVGKPYGYPGCPVEEEPTELPPHCGNNVVDEDEECDMGRFNGKRTCSEFCTLLSCGDGKVSPHLGEECDEVTRTYVEHETSGEIVIERTFVEAACGLSCKAPICDADGVCHGGCKRQFLPACVSSTIGSSSSSYAVSSAPLIVATAYPPRSSPSSGVLTRPLTCGNGTVEEPEQCDDGNQVAGDTCTNFCTIPACGDGIVQQGEGCDDGNTVNTDSCTASCQPARCGDGVVQVGEQCDDGNQIESDICTNACRLGSCGDGVIQGGEQCDDGNTVNADSCTNACRIPGCGDGVVQFGEQCDDGNGVNTDSCTNSCLPARCGDRIVQSGEECDDGNTVEADSCTNACLAARCGDGIVQRSEECDDGNPNTVDSCSNRCQLPVCGNGVREGGEQCDDGNMLDGDACSSECRLPSCGNARIEEGEECDAGQRNSDGRPNTCRTDCRRPFCGDGVRDEEEECDGSDDCTQACTRSLSVLHGAAGAVASSVVLAIFGTLASLGYVFRKMVFGRIKVRPRGGGPLRSIDDIPLDEIEMPWHF